MKKSMELIDEGENMDIEDALQLELEGLNWIFNTKDARAGLGSIIERKRPEFRGE